jgi:hypothetical protein
VKRYERKSGFRDTKANAVSFKVVQLNHKHRFHTTSRCCTVNIYSEINFILNGNPLNHETQLKIERFLLNHGLNILNEKDNQIHGIYTGLYSKKTAKFLLKFTPDITKKIKTFLNFKNQFSNEKSSSYKLFLVDIIENTGIPFVLTILLGRFIKILSNSKLNYTGERNSVLNIAIDLSDDLMREYFKLKYQARIKQLTDEGVITNSHEYTFSN